MTRIPVRFIYETGIARNLFANPLWLRGNWADGRLSEHWTNTKMTRETGTDGCFVFTAVVEFEPDQVRSEFLWGVGSGATYPEEWLIMTEVRDVNSTDRLRSFTLAAPENTDQVYRLSVSRWFGAQKYLPTRGGPPQLRFVVWAPTALKVEVVIGRLWLEEDQQTRKPFNPPGAGSKSARVRTIRGGYIANDGDGILPGKKYTIPMRPLRNGEWISIPPNPLRFAEYDHRPYMYRVMRRDGHVYRTDIHSRCQIGGGSYDPHGTHFDGATMALEGGKSCSVVVDPDTVTRVDMISCKSDRLWPEQFIEQNEFWSGLERPARVEGRTYPGRVEDLVIYELHLGSLGFGHNGPGTLDDALGLLDYLDCLGVNAVELLPLAEFGGGADNWGYATSHHFAVEYEGGGRDHFKLFVRECHRRGIAVIMDVVYNHYVHDADRAEWLYDTTDHANNCYYWYEGRPADYPAFNAAAGVAAAGQGGYLDNQSTGFAPRYSEEVVRKTLVSSAVVLLEEFHVDGFRVDQTTSIHSYNVLHADNRQSIGSANAYGGKLLREFSRTLRTVRPDVILIAEDHSAWQAMTQPLAEGGIGFDAVWYADYHHHLVGRNYGENYAKLIPTASDGSGIPLAIDWFAGALSVSGHHKVVYHTSHDEAGNADKDNADRQKRTRRTIVTAIGWDPDVAITGLTREYAEARCRFAAGVTLFSAGTPLILFGEEVCFQKDFKYDAVLSNREDLIGYRDCENRGRFMFRFYEDAVRLRLSNPGLRSQNISVLHTHNANRVIVFKRWGEGQEFLVFANLNNVAFDSPGYGVCHPDICAGSRWREVFNSDSVSYRGRNVGNSGATLTAQPGCLVAVIPSNGVVVFIREW